MIERRDCFPTPQFSHGLRPLAQGVFSVQVMSAEELAIVICRHPGHTSAAGRSSSMPDGALVSLLKATNSWSFCVNPGSKCMIDGGSWYEVTTSTGCGLSGTGEGLTVAGDGFVVEFLDRCFLRGRDSTVGNSRRVSGWCERRWRTPGKVQWWLWYWVPWPWRMSQRGDALVDCRMRGFQTLDGLKRGLKWGSGLTTIWVGMPPWDERVGIEDSEGIGARVWRWRRNCEALKTRSTIDGHIGFIPVDCWFKKW